MADNFDLRQFLTENKLTKNTQLLNEAVTLDGKPVDINSIEIDDIDTGDYPDFSDAYITYAEYEDGTPLTEEELMRLEDENYGLTNELIFDKQLYLEGKKETWEEGADQGFYDEEDDDSDKYLYDEFEDDDDISGAKETDYQYNIGGFMRENKYKTSPNSKQAQDLKKGDIITSGDEVVSVSAGAKTPSGKVEVTLKNKDGKTRTSTWGKTTKIGLKVKETEKQTVKESTMTQRDKYLTRLVENALGLDRDDDEGTFDPGHDIEQAQHNVERRYEGYGDDNAIAKAEKRGEELPEKPTYSEGEEMVNEKPLPKYENIEKLMQEIDKNTDEEAHKYKISEMKRVADGLEKKCTALEEGEDADHIDQKKLKQMKKDVMSLRKTIEKMEKVAEKKFTKKEPKADLKEGFDLRNFLIENKLTTNSRILKEYIEADEESVAEAFQQAGIDLSQPVFVVEARSVGAGGEQDEPYQVSAGQLLKTLEQKRKEYNNEETGVQYDYNAADTYSTEESGLPENVSAKLAVTFGDEYEYVIFQ